MENKEKLLNDFNTSLQRIKTFSCPEFKDVYSKTYFQEVLKDSLNDNKEPYSFIFGDFNKLGVINDLYGHDFGDKALDLAMKIIKKSIPKNSVIVRAGGDEIYIIIPNSDKEIAEKCCSSINKNLQKNAILIGGLSIELASSDSNYGNIDELIDLTDNEVTNIKTARQEDNSPADILSDNFLPLQSPDSISNKEQESWEKLNDLINISIYEFIQNFRPSKNFKFDKEQLTNSTDFITNSFIYLLNEKLNGKLPENITKLIEKDYPYMPEVDDYSEKKDKNPHQFSTDTCDLIHSLVTGDINVNSTKFSDEKLIELTNTLNELLENLVRDNTGLLDKQYFRHTLAKEICKSDEDFSASYLTVSGIKISNSAFDHSFTDKRLDKTNSIICDEAQKELHFTNKSFDFSDDNIYMLSQTGGNYLFLYNKKIADEIQPKIQKVANNTSSLANIKDPNSSFRVTCYHSGKNQTVPKSSPDSLIRYVRALKEEANYNKIEIKKDLFNSSDSFFAFKKNINNCIDYYVKNISDNPDDIKKLTQFIKNVYISFLNQEVLHNETRHTKKTSGLDSKNDFDR